MPNYRYQHEKHDFLAVRPMGTRTTRCIICGNGDAERLLEFGLIPQGRGGINAVDFHWDGDLKANHEEALGAYAEAKEILAEERANGLKA